MKPIISIITIGMVLLMTSTLAEAEVWAQLTPIQREALAPLSQEWNSLPSKRQQHYLSLANGYATLTPPQKAAFTERLAKWHHLTPEQRQLAREKFKHFKKLPVEKREEVKRMIKEKSNPNPVPNSAPLPVNN
jgi:hypothetical protein